MFEILLFLGLLSKKTETNEKKETFETVETFVFIFLNIKIQSAGVAISLIDDISLLLFILVEPI